MSNLAKSKNIEINITQVRLSRHEDWLTCRGKILVLRPTIPLKYAMSVLVKGALVLPWKNEIPGVFDYRNYLKSKGIKHAIWGEDLMVMDPNPSRR